MMSLLSERRHCREIIDLPITNYSLSEYTENLADIRKVNRFFGDYHATLKHFSSIIPVSRSAIAGPIRVLDIATGSADIPVAIVMWARKQGIQIKVTAIDNNPLAVREAAAFTRRYPEITVTVSDAFSMPFEDESFDIVLCTKALHHCSEEHTITLLKEISRVAAIGYIIMDLRRSCLAWALISVFTRLFTRNRLTRHDGPLSVLRSYTVSELGALVGKAGLISHRLVKEPFWLMVVSGKKERKD